MPILDGPRLRLTRITNPRCHDPHVTGTVCMKVSPSLCLLLFPFFPLSVCLSF